MTNEEKQQARVVLCEFLGWKKCTTGDDDCWINSELFHMKLPPLDWNLVHEVLGKMSDAKRASLPYSHYNMLLLNKLDLVIPALVAVVREGGK